MTIFSRIKKNHITIVYIAMICCNVVVEQYSATVLVALDVLFMAFLFFRGVLTQRGAAAVKGKRILEMLLLLLMLFILVSFAVNLNGNFLRQGGFTLFHLGSIGLLLYYLIFEDAFDAHSKGHILSAVLYSNVAMACLVLLFSGVAGDINRAYGYVWPGVQVNANAVAYPFTLALLAGTYKLVTDKSLRAAGNDIVCLGVLALMMGIFKTRGALLGLVLGMALLIVGFFINGDAKLRRRSFILIGAWVLLFAGAAAIFFYRSAASGISLFSSNGRYALWGIAVDYFKAHPLFGAGSAILYDGNFSSHNLVFDFFSQYGTVPGILVIFVCIRLLFKVKGWAAFAFLFAGFIQAGLDAYMLNYIFMAFALALVMRPAAARRPAPLFIANAPLIMYNTQYGGRGGQD